MASRELMDLHPAVRELCIKHKAACAAAGIELMIYCTYRSIAEQEQLYSCGRTAPGKIVTNCSGGASKHNHTEAGQPASLAYDCVPILGGKPLWNDTQRIKQVGILGESVGLKWAGRWQGALKESVHFER